MRLRSLFIVPTLLALTSPGRAERPRDTVTLNYLTGSTKAAICPEQDFFDNEVQLRVGYALFQPAASRHLTLKLDRVQGQFHIAAKMTDDQGDTLFEEDFPARECAAAVVHAAVAVSIAFAQLPELPELPEPPPPPPSLPVQECAPGPVAPRPPPAPPQETWHWNAGLAAVAAAGKAPAILGGPGLSFGARWHDVSAAVEARALFAPAVALGRFTSSYLFTSGSFSLCFHYLWALGCARVESGGTFVGDSQVAYAHPSSRVYIGGGARLGGEWVLSPFLSMRVHVEVMGTTAGANVISANRGNLLWSSPAISSSFGFGPSISF